ncbi:Adenine DNA glycosylase [Vibrio stylophorae]|uniref:Adenine DNA glycosylase n=1 Tax=Vibrio stylophorae TaxID=659351 RepID=A0ABN8DS13_9VIBR|nr:A/G-specific adenine glycosylase [Vibrio stylophorae]CAH0532588.1 Adenine DNA glycosylase [Vibrio stylophorae]
MFTKACAVIAPHTFSQTLLTWQQQHGRHDLPWQREPNPYSVLVSEIMLQQTQVATVIPYFERWMARFPDIAALANADEDEVMHLWQGLGYYSRARNLRKAAQYVMHECQGEFPTSLAALEKIPGVGRYTAGAIASFAYNQYGPIVDGNVKRLFCRFFAIDGVPGTSRVDKLLWQLAEHYTPEPKALSADQSNRSFAQSLLDMGATICTAKNPNCTDCPLHAHCQAKAQNRVGELPNPKPKKVTPTKPGEFLWLEHDNKLLLEKRADSGIWGSLWCLPQIHLDEAELSKNAQLKGKFKHTFTHYKLDARVWRIDSLGQLSANQAWFDRSACDELGLPTPIRKFVSAHFQQTSEQSCLKNNEKSTA